MGEVAHGHWSRHTSKTKEKKAEGVHLLKYDTDQHSNTNVGSASFPRSLPLPLPLSLSIYLSVYLSHLGPSLILHLSLSSSSIGLL